MKNWKRTFLKPITPRQKQYEVLRAIAVEKSDIPTVAKKFGYSVSTVYSLIRDVKSGKLILFPDLYRGPKERQMPIAIQQLIFDYRSLNLSVTDICSELRKKNHDYSVRTVQRILEDALIPKLNRRTFSERGKTLKNQIIPERTRALDFDRIEPFRYDCPVAGIFFFLPYLIESGVIDILKQCKLPKSSDINAEQACLSMLLLKLIGGKRLGHIAAYDHEPGFGVFAGLNFLPKSTYISTYSCRTSDAVLQDFQQQVMTLFQKKYPDFYQSNVINLDFHSIPHFGEQSKMEKVWCGARSKAMKGANTIFAQDGKSNAILYTHADILHKDEASEIIRFVSYWKAIRQEVNETLVFDCKLTTYGILDTLMQDNIKFITLRKRNKKLLADTENIPESEWQKIYIPIPKRKHKACLIHVSDIVLPKCTKPVKQIIITHHGRAQPTYVVTNNKELSLKEILIVYAKRWHIEQKFVELVSFFNLNALSSPLMIRIHFDILWTVIADTLYHRFSQDLPRFEHERADSIFRRFVNTPGQIIYDGKNFILKIRKRAHTPILLGVKKLQKNISIPWLGNRTLKIEWTA